jgi:hypothetical protein
MKSYVEPKNIDTHVKYIYKMNAENYCENKYMKDESDCNVIQNDTHVLRHNGNIHDVNVPQVRRSKTGNKLDKNRPNLSNMNGDDEKDINYSVGNQNENNHPNLGSGKSVNKCNDAYKCVTEGDENGCNDTQYVNAFYVYKHNGNIHDVIAPQVYRPKTGNKLDKNGPNLSNMNGDDENDINYSVGNQNENNHPNLGSGKSVNKLNDVYKCVTEGDENGCNDTQYVNAFYVYKHNGNIHDVIAPQVYRPITGNKLDKNGPNLSNMNVDEEKDINYSGGNQNENNHPNLGSGKSVNKLNDVYKGVTEGDHGNGKQCIGKTSVNNDDEGDVPINYTNKNAETQNINDPSNNNVNVNSVNDNGGNNEPDNESVNNTTNDENEASLKHTHSLSIIVWNINGLSSKYDDPDFIEYCRRYDVIAFTETWADLEDQYTIDGYEAFSSVRERKPNAIRNSGGICVFIKNDIKTELIKKCTDVIWFDSGVQLNNEYNTPIVMGIVYIPPVNSVYANVDIFNAIENDMEDIIKDKGDCHFLIAGDYNARTGISLDFVDDYDENNEIVNIPDIPADKFTEPRYSRDKICNNYGVKLLNLCKTTHMRILNGRLFNDKGIGDYTYITRTGKSVVDYVIASEDLLISHFFTNFEIANRGESDHLPITFDIQYNKVINETDDEILIQYQSENLYIWNEERINEYKQNWNSVEVQSIIDECANVNDDPNLILNMIYDMFKTTSSTFLKSKRKGSNQRKGAKWYDKECYNKKREMKEALRKYRMNRTDDLLERYLNVKSNYKKILDQKKEYPSKADSK